jgi:spermidine synthase
MVFPYLFRVAQRSGVSPGSILGDLGAVNTVGGIFGSLAAGFLLIGWFGLWDAIGVLAALYLLLALLVSRHADVRWLRLLASASLAVAVISVVMTEAPIVRLRGGDQLVEVWQDGYGVVAVVRQGAHRLIKLDGTYSLGSTLGVEGQRSYGDLPLLLHPDPQSVFFLGLGTSITASAAISYPIGRIVACELVPNVITAARTHFTHSNRDFFNDDRVRVVPEDGRNYLAGTSEPFDVVIADLFVPWRRGVSALYSVDHYSRIRDRLNPGGLFAQWLPTYHVSRQEFDIIVRSMLEVFPQVTLWRSGLNPTQPAVALIGHVEPSALSLDRIAREMETRTDVRNTDSFRSLDKVLTSYIGDLSRVSDWFANAPLNTEDHPVIEFMIPVTNRRSRSGEVSGFVNAELLEFQEQLQNAAPPEDDPYLVHASSSQRDAVLGGTSLFGIRVSQNLERKGEQRRYSDEVRRLLSKESINELLFRTGRREVRESPGR